MPLEAVMVVIDNSDYTRNGDYVPSRFEAESDAIQLVCNSKTSDHPENCVGLLCSAGDRIDVLLTPTDDFGRMLAEVAKVKLGGSSDLLRGIQTAQLALKHRSNKNQKQRIVAFVGSPISATEKELEVLGKNLKKNNVSLDLVSFGEVDENQPKLDKLLGAVNSSDTSHLVSVPVGPKQLSDVLVSSPIIGSGDAAAAGGGGGGDGAGFEFGIDPNADPELALALRISMEEERARQQAADGGAPAPGGGATGGDAAATTAGTTPAAEGTAAAPTSTPAPTAGTEPLPMATDAAVLDAMGMEDMDEELRQALLLSLQESGPMDTSSAPPAEAPATETAPPVATEAPKAAGPEKKDVAMTEAPAETKAEGTTAAASADPMVDAQWFQDPTFVSELLGSLPGVDINDPRIQSALQSVGGEAGTGDEEKKDEDKDKK
jgi:26S proteasome regulatory subunit N10